MDVCLRELRLWLVLKDLVDEVIFSNQLKLWCKLRYDMVTFVAITTGEFFEKFLANLNVLRKRLG